MKYLATGICIMMMSCNKSYFADEMKISSTHLGDNLQLMEVITSQVAATSGTMYLYERNRINDKFNLVDSIPVVIGRNGFAWDNSSSIKRGFQRVKQEGDGCSPAGIFSLGNVFSYHEMKNIKMPFTQVDESHLCVDDVKSVYYNKLIDSSNAQPDYDSFENMKRSDELYEYGIWVNYNNDPVVKGNGSCIFLHIWQDETTPTSGCTAMSKENMLKLIRWLDENKKPVLLQYPQFSVGGDR